MLGNIPMSFKYDGKLYRLNDDDLKLISKIENEKNNVRHTTYIYDFLDGIRVSVITDEYADFNAITWTVWFENTGFANTKVISDLKGIDTILEGENPVLKGILGDHHNQYKPYETDLKDQDVAFRQETGRATHIYFPYFLLESDKYSYLLAIGWSGTWNASFSREGSGTRYVAQGVNDLCTYMKPGEKIRTPLVCLMTCNANRDKSVAMNHWRRWFVTHIMPRRNDGGNEPVDPMITSWFALDTGRPNSDGSISEYYGSWKPSMDKYFEEGLDMDIRWVDAGWYYDANNNTVESDWWGTVGTWELDRVKWPGDTFRQSVDYAKKHGANTMMWFEPERVTNVEALAKNYGFDPAWAYTDGGGLVMANLTIPGCVDWLTERITKTMEDHGVHMYREDFNCDPGHFFRLADERAKEEGDRKGIFENLYIQGHYRLWDNIIDYCRRSGKMTVIDSCASGGGRNDLESMRRAVPFLRSDSDRTSTGLRLSMTTSFMDWIPCCGASTKETINQLEAGAPDIYVLRASYLPIFNYGFEYVHDKDLDYDLLRHGQREWKMIKPYFYGDFYVLTPWHPQNETDKWTVFMYIQDNSGIIQAFRQETCEEDTVSVKVKGIDEDKWYGITDLDERNSFQCIKGSDLAKGFEISLPEKRMAAVLLINEI